MSQQRQIHVANGWVMLVVTMILFGLGASLFIGFTQATRHNQSELPMIVWSFLLFGLGVFSCFGFFTVQPNEARVLILFGDYRGSVHDDGFHWTNPLNTKLRKRPASRASGTTDEDEATLAEFDVGQKNAARPETGRAARDDDAQATKPRESSHAG